MVTITLVLMIHTRLTAILTSLVTNVLGVIKIWDFLSRKCVLEIPLHKDLNIDEKEESSFAIVHAELCENIQCVAVVTADHNIILFTLDGMRQTKQVWIMRDIAIAFKISQNLCNLGSGRFTTQMVPALLIHFKIGLKLSLFIVCRL